MKMKQVGTKESSSKNGLTVDKIFLKFVEMQDSVKRIIAVLIIFGKRPF